MIDLILENMVAMATQALVEWRMIIFSCTWMSQDKVRYLIYKAKKYVGFRFSYPT